MSNKYYLSDSFGLGWGLLWRTSLTFLLVQIFLIGFGQYFLIPTNEILIFSAEDIVKLKPTISYFAFFFLLIAVRLLSSKSLVFALFGQRLHLTAAQWKRFDCSLLAMLVVIGSLNIIIAYFMSVEAWVKFKLFGSNIVFLCSFPLIAAWLLKVKP